MYGMPYTMAHITGAVMGELARARDRLQNAIRGDSVGGADVSEVEAAFSDYNRVVRDHFLTDIEEELAPVQLAVEESRSSAATVVLGWVTAILYRDRG